MHITIHIITLINSLTENSNDEPTYYNTFFGRLKRIQLILLKQKYFEDQNIVLLVQILTVNIKSVELTLGAMSFVSKKM